MINTKKVVLTGPESTGKSTLTKQLAEYFSVPYVSEIARDYILNLNKPYNYNDVLKIAELQIEAENRILNVGYDFVFFDTDLIITKIWLLHCFGKCPKWIDEELKKNAADLHLLCYYDLLWEPDPVRENPEIRSKLFEKYENEIILNGLKYAVIKGVLNERFDNAKIIVQEFLTKK